MKSLDTSIAAWVAAVGLALHDIEALPVWLRTLAKVMEVAGLSILGQRSVSHHWLAKSETQFLNKPKP